MQKKQVEGEEDAFPSAEEQIVEHGMARVLDAGNLAIEDSIVDIQVLADPLRQSLEVAERVPILGDEIALTVLDVGQRSKAIDLQFVEEFLRIERFGTAGKPHRA